MAQIKKSVPKEQAPASFFQVPRYRLKPEIVDLIRKTPLLQGIIADKLILRSVRSIDRYLNSNHPELTRLDVLEVIWLYLMYQDPKQVENTYKSIKNLVEING